MPTCESDRGQGRDKGKKTSTVRVKASVDDFLRCTLCNEYLTDAHTINRCVHTFCKDCLTSLFQRQHAVFKEHKGRKFACPRCFETLDSSNPMRELVRPDRVMQGIVDNITGRRSGDDDDRQGSPKKRKLASSASSASAAVRERTVYFRLEPCPSTAATSLAASDHSVTDGRSGNGHDENVDQRSAETKANSTNHTSADDMERRETGGSSTEKELDQLNGKAKALVSETGVDLSQHDSPEPTLQTDTERGGGESNTNTHTPKTNTEIAPLSSSPPADLARLQRPLIKATSRLTVQQIRKIVALGCGLEVDQAEYISIHCKGDTLGSEHTLDFVLKTRWHTNALLLLHYRYL